MYKIIAIIALVGGLGAFHFWDRGVAVHNAEIAVTARLNKEWQEKWNIAKQEADTVQEQLILLHGMELEDKNAKIKDINGKLSSLRLSLQQRSSRTEYTPDTSDTGEACTGRELFRQDGEFLAGEASRADQLVVERDFYYNEYEKTRLFLEQLRN